MSKFNIFILLISLICTSCFSYTVSSEDSIIPMLLNTKENSTLPQIEVSKIVTNNGKTYLTVDNIPFPIFGAQIRLDAFLVAAEKVDTEE